MTNLAKHLEAIYLKQPRMTSEEFWKQVEESRRADSTNSVQPSAKPWSSGDPNEASLMVATS